MRKRPIYLVAYIDDAGETYACAFSTRQIAEAFNEAFDGTIIETYVDIHADLTLTGLEPF
jgi:hypothetical protein